MSHLSFEGSSLVVKLLFTPVQVVLDLWEHLEMCKEGQMSWLSRQLDEANFIITVCSKGLRYSSTVFYSVSDGIYSKLLFRPNTAVD